VRVEASVEWGQVYVDMVGGKRALRPAKKAKRRKRERDMKDVLTRLILQEGLMSSTEVWDED
jgi:hypothetical protein